MVLVYPRIGPSTHDRSSDPLSHRDFRLFWAAKPGANWVHGPALLPFPFFAARTLRAKAFRNALADSGLDSRLSVV
jgi:hypothetical protein